MHQAMGKPSSWNHHRAFSSQVNMTNLFLFMQWYINYYRVKCSVFNCPHWQTVTLLHSLIERGNTFSEQLAFSEWLFLPYTASYDWAWWTAQADGQLWETEWRRFFSQPQTQQLMLRSSWEAPLCDGAYLGSKKKPPEAFSIFIHDCDPREGSMPLQTLCQGRNVAAWAHITLTLLTISPAAWGYDALVTLT